MGHYQAESPFLEEVFLRIGFGRFHVLVIFIFGFIQFFYAVEMICLSFLGPILICIWEITLLESSFITMAVFIGMALGSLFFGKLSDSYGRKLIVVLSSCGIFYFSLLCAFSPSVIWIIIVRAIIGIFIGGFSTMVYTYLPEVMTMDQRGTAVICVQIFWSMGSYYISLLTVTLIPQFGWRLWLVISTSPMVIIVVISIWIPESPRYLLLKNRMRDALQVINHISSMNGSEHFPSVRNADFKKSSWKDLFHSSYILSTCICMYVCFVSGISYYGFVFSSSVINHIPHRCLQDMKTILNPALYTNESVDNSCCFPMTWVTMNTVLISITGELTSYIIGILFIKYMKRKLYLQILLFINAIVFFLMNLCLSPSNMGILMMFGRGSGGTIMRVNLLYISEVFPTNIRSFSIGLGNFFVRTGAMFASLVVNMIMIKTSFLIGTLFYCFINLLGLIFIFVLPFETRDRALQQSVEDDITEIKVTKKGS